VVVTRSRRRAAPLRSSPTPGGRSRSRPAAAVPAGRRTQADQACYRVGRSQNPVESRAQYEVADCAGTAARRTSRSCPGIDRTVAGRRCPPHDSRAGSAGRSGSRRTGGGRRDRSGWLSNRAKLDPSLPLARPYRPWHTSFAGSDAGPYQSIRRPSLAQTSSAATGRAHPFALYPLEIGTSISSAASSRLRRVRARGGYGLWCPMARNVSGPGR
jgi:hypothetical protein